MNGYYESDKYLDNIEDMEGKTIEKVYHPHNELLLFIFTDGMFINIEPKRGYDGDAEFEVEKIEYYTAHKAGLISQEEFYRLKIEYKKEYEKESLAKQKRQYEDLKVKFEGVTK